MCSHYQGLKEQERLRRHFGVEPPPDLGKTDLWPGYAGTFIRLPARAQADHGPAAEPQALNGLFGMVPHWSPDTRMASHTYNARSETVASKPSFRDAWRKAQHCIIPAEAIFEPDWRSGRAVPTRIARADGEPMGIAGLWARWRSPQGQDVYSYTMLTINAAAHPLMRLMHKPADEKRMVVILTPAQYVPWLQCDVEQSGRFLRPYPAEWLTATSPSVPLGLF